MSDVLNSKQHLINIDFLRIVLIMLMVFYHSFCFYSGAWEIPAGAKPIYFYSVLSNLSYSFFLETFVFISGLLYGVSAARRVGKLKLSIVLMKKVKRLMLPSIIFSSLYFLCFKDYTSLAATFYAILLGCGHLWFLPTLFGCFIFIMVIEKYQVKDKIILSLYPLLIVFSIPDMPLHLSKICYYFCFFYLGYRMMVYKKVYSCNMKFLLLLFVVTFSIDILPLPIGDWNLNGYLRIFSRLFELILRICYSTCGLLLSMKICSLITQNDKILSMKANLSKIASYGMGVYIVQQFVLMWLYYHTEYCLLVNDYFIPWIAFVFTICVSLIVVFIARKSQLGRFLLG
jgi:hypothetical protein